MSAFNNTNVIYAVENDYASRKIEASLFSDGTPWMIPDGCSVSVSYKKTDGTTGWYNKLEDGSNAVSYSGNVVTVSLAAQSLTVAGDVFVSIVFNEPSTLKQLASFPFVVKVSDFLSGSGQISNNFYKYGTIGELNDSIVSLEKSVSKMKEAFYVHVTKKDGVYYASETYDKIAEAVNWYYTRKERPVFCILWDNRPSDFIVLPFTSYEAYEGGVIFTKLQYNYEVIVTIKKDAVEVGKVYIPYKHEIPEALPNPEPLYVTVSDDGLQYSSDTTYAEIRAARDGGREVYCLAGEVILPMVSDDGDLFAFGAMINKTSWFVGISADDSVHAASPTLAAESQIPTALPNPQLLTINGQSYDGSAAADIVTTALTVTVNSLDDGGYTCDKTVDEMKAAHNAGRELYCVWGARLPMVGEYGATSSNIWGYTFRGIVSGKEYSVNIGTDGISVTYTKLVPDALPNPQPLTINGQSYDGSEAESLELPPLEKVDFFDEAYCGILGGLVNKEGIFWSSATATSIKLAVEANTAYIVKLPGCNRNVAAFSETGDFSEGTQNEPLAVGPYGDGNHLRFTTGEKAGYVAVYFHTGGYDIDGNIADIHVYKDSIKADPNPKIPGKYLPTVGYEPLDMLIFGDSITANVTISYNDGKETTAYTPDAVDNSYTDSDGTNVYYSQWPALIQRLIPVAEMRNYAQSGATYKDAVRGSGYERQNLSFQIDLALNDLSNPNGVFAKDNFDPDIVIFAIGINDDAVNDTYESAMAKTVMSSDGKSFDVDATLANLDLSKFNEAMRHAFIRIKKNFPTALVLCVLPLQQTYGTEADRITAGEHIRKMAQRYSITVIDGYAESGIVRDFEVQDGLGALLKDGIHPNEKGQNLYARMMVQAIRRYYLPLDGLN